MAKPKLIVTEYPSLWNNYDKQAFLKRACLWFPFIQVYPFDFSYTEQNCGLLQCGRNITHMKDLARKFFQGSQNDSRPFLLYIGFFDAHRSASNPKKYGEFNKHILDKVLRHESGNYRWLYDF